MKLGPLAFGLALALPLTLAAQTEPRPGMAPAGLTFLHKLAQEDRAEIRLANLALRKSSNQQVKKYANNVLAADPDMARAAERIAQRYQPPSASAGGVAAKAAVRAAGAKSQAEYRMLSRLSGAKFDRAYMKYEARKQVKDLHLVEHQAAVAANPRLQGFAAQQEAPVKKAANSARKILAGLR